MSTTQSQRFLLSSQVTSSASIMEKDDKLDYHHFSAVSNWETEQVCAWLNDCGLGKFCKFFRANDITGEILFDLDHRNLKEMSIRAVGDRAKILLSISKLRMKSIIHSLPKISSSDSLAYSTASSQTSSPSTPPASHYRAEDSKRISIRPAPINTTTYEAQFITDLSGSDTSPITNPTFFSPKFSSFFDTFRKKTQSTDNSTISSPKCPPVSDPAYQDIMKFESVRRHCIRVYGDDGASHVLNTSELDSPSKIIDRIYRKFGIERRGSHEYYHCLVAIEESGAVQFLSEEKLWKICTDIPPHPLKDKIRFQKILPVSPGTTLPTKFQDETLEHGSRASKMSMAINERPSSDIISLNLEVFFPSMDERQHHSSSIQALVQKKAKNSFQNSFERPPRSPLRKNVSNPYKVSEKTSLFPLREDQEKGLVSSKSDSEDDNLFPSFAKDLPLYDALAYIISSTESEVAGLTNWIKGDLIGRGSFASVYYGINPVTGDLLAVKQVEIPHAPDILERRTKFLQSLTREIDLLKSLRHKNIVGYIGSICDGNFLNVFLEYIDGGSMSHLIETLGCLSPDDTAHYTYQILEGLEYLHAKNIVHRDIKGANILVTSGKSVKISDFGVSKWVGKVLPTKRFSLQGSIYWMAPEMIRKNECTSKVDIWSLGCLVLEMLTGDHPWKGFDQIQAMYQIGMGTWTPLEHFLSPNTSRSFSTSSPTGSRPVSSFMPSSVEDHESSVFSKRSSIVFDNTDISRPYICLPAKDFMESCFISNPERRSSATELLTHSFLTHAVDRT